MTLRASSLTTLLVLASFGMAHADSPTIPPEGPPWSLGSGFTFAAKQKDSRRSVSGIACPAEVAVPRRCVAVFDEGVEARYVTIDGQGMSPEPDRIVLLPGGKELDAEGAAWDGAFVFVVGSHSAKRNDCANNPDSRHVVRFNADRVTGRAQLSADGRPVGLVSDDGRLWRLLTGHPVLRTFAGDRKCLGSGPPPRATSLRGLHGVNIEGVAAKDGRLYFGFRGPAIDGKAHVLNVAAGALFSGGDLSDTLVTLSVGQGRSIRDLLAVPEGLLLLIGPDDDAKETVGWSVAFWDGVASDMAAVIPRTLAHLALPLVRQDDCDKEIKPEALTIVENGSGFRRVLILSDGMCDGGPLVFRIPK